MQIWFLCGLGLAVWPGLPAPLEIAALAELRALEAEALFVPLVEIAERTERELCAHGRGARAVLLAQVTERLAARRLARKEGQDLPCAVADLRRTVVDFEAFKLVRFVTSGVFPKRYFGYLDLRNDTAALERRLRDATRQAVGTINAYQEERGHRVRVSDLEVVVTFLAEGGAILLRERQDLLARLHPVFDVGLDDVALGFGDLPGLRERLDREAGTDLGGLVGWAETLEQVVGLPSPIPVRQRLLKHGHGDGAPWAFLQRYMSLEEAVVGTALMYLWEKEIAARKLKALGHAPIMERGLEEQFVIASLVYNSGQLHAPARWRQILAGTAADWLVDVSRRNAHRRPRLPVERSAEALAGLEAGLGYPDQPTSWVAVYHVLQRHGAFLALQRYTDHFDELGMFQAPVR